MEPLAPHGGIPAELEAVLTGWSRPPGVEVFAVKGASDEWLLLMSVAVTDSLSLSSGLIDWEGGRVVAEGGAAMLDDVAARLRREFLEYVWVRVASELSEVRRILTALGAERDPPVQ